MIGVFIKRGEETEGQIHTERRMPCEDTDTQGEQHTMMKAEIGVMGLQAKEHQGLLATPEARERHRKQIFPQNMQKEDGPAYILIPDFQPPEL